MKIRALILTAAFLSTATGTALAYCSEPSTPYCTNGYGHFDQSEFSSCKSDLESYKSEIEDFIQCKQREVNEANDEARKAASEADDVARKARNDVDEQTSNYNQAVRSFNSRAGN